MEGLTKFFRVIEIILTIIFRLLWAVTKIFLFLLSAVFAGISGGARAGYYDSMDAHRRGELEEEERRLYGRW